MTTKENEKEKETDADKLLKKATGKIGSSYKYGGQDLMNLIVQDLFIGAMLK